MKLIQVQLSTYAILEQFMHYYQDELYDYVNSLEMDEYGNYIYEGLEEYVMNPDLRAFLIYDEDRYKGFVLINKGHYIPKGYDYSIQEFFVAKPYRHQKIATRILKAVFEHYKGKFFIMQLEKNVPAIRFWHKYLESQEISYVEKRQIIDGESCLTQTFLII